MEKPSRSTGAMFYSQTAAPGKQRSDSPMSPPQRLVPFSRNRLRCASRSADEQTIIKVVRVQEGVAYCNPFASGKSRTASGSG